MIDCHTHIFPDDIRLERERHFEREPSFQKLYQNPTSKIAGAEELIDSMDRNNVSTSVVFGYPWESTDRIRRHNDYVLTARGRYPDRLIGLCCVNPLLEGATAEVEHCLTGGLSGVGELAFYHRDLDNEVLEALDPIMAICRERSLPVVLHTNEPIGHHYPGKAPMTLKRIFELIRRYSGNRLVLAHWGGGLFWYRLLKKAADEPFRRVWFDTAASPFLYRPDIYRYALELIGEDRILFGSDYPLLEPERYRREMTAAGLTPAQIERISHQNAAELFQIQSL